MKIKEWPIVLTCSVSPRWLAIRLFYYLDQFDGQEAVEMCDTQCETINTGNDERSDLPLFHESRGSGAALDDARVGVHDLAGSALESVRAVAFEQTTEVAVGDYADPF
jgi:hypothetical protein